MELGPPCKNQEKHVAVGALCVVCLGAGLSSESWSSSVQHILYCNVE